MPQSSEELNCPFCLGQGRFRENPSYSSLPGKAWRWEYLPWPESEGGDGKIRAYAVCQACNGSGLYSDYCARRLADEFPPQDESKWKAFSGQWRWVDGSTNQPAVTGPFKKTPDP